MHPAGEFEFGPFCFRFDVYFSPGVNITSGSEVCYSGMFGIPFRDGNKELEDTE